ncbi:MAG: ABC transporter ATP-binding protein [Planctomycetota bacterium]
MRVRLHAWVLACVFPRCAGAPSDDCAFPSHDLDEKLPLQWSGYRHGGGYDDFMVVKLKDLWKSYGGKPALRGITLDLEPGQVLGYLGPNGAGKTTTVKILTATLKPDQGQASVCGFDTIQDPVAVKRNVGYVPEVAALYDTMTPMEYGRFIGRIHGIPSETLDYRLETFLSIFGLHESRHDPIATFSKGMKQKVLILTALIHNPPLIILDEPLNGLDANATLLLKEIISQLSLRGRTVFYCSHLLDVVEKICHRVVILKEGAVIACGTVDEVRKQSKGQSIESTFSAMTSTTDWETVARDFVDALAGTQ